MSFRRSATLLLAACLAAGCVHGASTGSVVLEAHVQDEHHQPLAGATIDGFGRAEDTTDATGTARPNAMAGYSGDSFLFWFSEILIYGPFEIRVSRPGYEPVVVLIEQTRLVRKPTQGVAVPATVARTFTLKSSHSTPAEERP